MVTMTFGEKLRELRKQANISQRELAKRVGIDFTYLSKIENNLMNPPAEKTIVKIAKELNTNEEELILLAKKVPIDVQDLITGNPLFVKFLRELEKRNYSNGDLKNFWELVDKKIKKRRKK